MSRQIAVALAALVALIGATVAAETVVAAPVEPTEEFTEDVEVNSGTWYCAPLVRENETATLSIAAVGDDPSQISVERVMGGESSFEQPIDLEPKATHELEIQGAAEVAAFVVRWRGGPAVASWRVDSAEQRVGTSCAQSPAPAWVIPGAETTVGSSARLYLFNPFDSDAVVRVAFATSEGRIDLVSSENVSVPAHEVVDVGINELQPEQSDLGILVEVEAGRVIASGLQRFGQADLTNVELEGAEPPTDPTAPEGRTTLPATAVPSSRVGLAYAASGEATSAWVSIVNPNSRPARVSVAVSDAIADSAIAEEIVVAPESVERIDLTNVSSAPNFGVTLTANADAPIAASGFVALTGERRRITSVSAIPEASTMNAEAMAPAESAAEIALYNPGQSAATATVAVGGTAPDAWSSIALEPGTMQLLSFDDAGAGDGGPVEASADQPIYATLRLSSDENRADRFLALPLIPANVWQGSADAPMPLRDRTLDTRPVDFPAQPDQ
jgi:Family of unknown function (DUF5719)